ncbi:MAG: terminase TerL endonuclease subunit [Planctomycetota bacterium]
MSTKTSKKKTAKKATKKKAPSTRRSPRSTKRPPPKPLTSAQLTACRRSMNASQKKQLAAGLARAKREGWSSEISQPQDAHALAAGAYFDERFADHAVAFFEKGLIHATGEFAGRPFKLIAWQLRLVRRIFGWRNAEGRRLIRSVFVYIPKKNGKSTFSAGLALYLQVGEPDPDQPERGPEPAQQIYVASTTAETGTIVFREASKLATASPALKPILEIKEQSRRIVCPKGQSFIKVLAHKATSAEGMIAGGVILDEIHAMKSRELYAALRYAGAGRRQPLNVEITTAGVDDPTALWRDRHRYTQRVLDGDVVDPTHTGALYEADPNTGSNRKGAPPLDDIAQLRKANPSIGETINEDDLVKSARQAMQEGPNSIAEFKRYRLNIATGAESGWINPETWDRGQKPFKLEDMVGRPCYSGLDLAKVSDFTALVLLWPPIDGEDPARWHMAPWFWLPRAQVLERSRQGDQSYQAWEAQGLIEVTDGDTTDHTVVRRRINEIAERFKPINIGIDRNFDGWQFCEDLFHDDELPAVGVGQGWRSQDVPMQRIEQLITDRLLNSGGNPVMRWMIANAIAKKVGPNSNYHLDKARAADKVDGVAALINAMFLAEVVPEEEGNGTKHPTYDFNPLVIL